MYLKLDRRIGDLALSSVKFEGDQYFAVVHGKEKDGIEVEFKVPLNFRVRKDRGKPPTLDEMKVKAQSTLCDFCVKTAWKIDHFRAIQQVNNLERSGQHGKAKPEARSAPSDQK